VLTGITAKPASLQSRTFWQVRVTYNNTKDVKESSVSLTNVTVATGLVYITLLSIKITLKCENYAVLEFLTCSCSLYVKLR
jgi:hypothetical protein